EPDLRTPAEAYAYLTKIRQIVQYLEICDGNMEEGSFRCDANVSIRPRGQETLGTRTELKNMNSFRNVERAIQFEIDRQIELVESGGSVVQKTLLWDANKLETREMRSKEEAHDYRYFPEPDIPPVVVSKELLEEIRSELPEMPDHRRQRFTEELKLSEEDAITLTESRYLADYFESVLEFLDDAKAVANVVMTETLRVLNEQGLYIQEFSISPERLAGLIGLKKEDKINSSALQTIFNEMIERDEPAEVLAEEMNLIQVSDTGFIEPIVEQVVADNPEEAQKYRDGKKQVIGFFIGQVMKQSKGKANPKQVRELIAEKLNSG
ncbi:MAG: Asp-tRNA(Asn)/Glu-tRNA(Gln) amidotransferase subunit GatB, partial [Balneolaceae bacterium]